MKVVQIGSNKSYDDLSNYLLSNYENIEFGLFVEPNSFHIESIKECYQKYDNAIIENIAIKTPNYKENQIEIYYHTSDPDYQISSCKIDHIEGALEWSKNNNKYLHDMFKDGEIKSFLVDCITLDELFEKYKIKELDWLCLDIEGLDAEILLTFDFQKYKIRRIEFEHLHLGYYKNSIKNMMLGMGYVQVNSLHEYDWAFENRNILFSKEKLKNFPSVNFISIEESENRRNVLYENFKKYGIENITPHIFEKYNDDDHKIIGKDIDILTPKNHRGPVTSHLKAIKKWYENTDEEYTIFCEDDISFETVQYWNFTWEEFFNKLPEDWECVQLSFSSTHEIYLNRILFEMENKLRPRDWCDWSCVAYLMKRSHAKKIIDNYYPDDTFCLEYKGIDLPERISLGEKWVLIPNVETLAYSLFEKNKFVFTFPLFVESMDFNCTWGDFDGFSYGDENDTSSPDYILYKSTHTISYEKVIEWWKNIGQYLSLDNIICPEYLSHWYS